MVRHYLVHVERDGQSEQPEPKLIGPYMTASLQTSAARLLRDQFNADFVNRMDDELFWLDINDGVPSVGAFDPMFWTERD